MFKERKLRKLKNDLESADLIAQRDVQVELDDTGPKLAGVRLIVSERGNPDVSLNTDVTPARYEGEAKVPELVHDRAEEILGGDARISKTVKKSHTETIVELNDRK